MFISKAEKTTILETIELLSAQVSTLRRDVFDLKLAAGMTKPVKVDRRKKGMSDDARKKHSERMKKLWADRKAQKETV
jgi:hypothetical protein